MAASESQQLVINEVKTGSGNVSVQATAGAGKTYTLLETLKVVPRFKKSVFLAFSGAIVKELKDKVPAHIKASTLHSLGCRMIYSKYPDCKLNENKYFSLALNMYEKKTKEVYRDCYIIQDICNYARLTLTPFEYDSLNELCSKYMIESTPEMLTVAEIILEENTKNKFLSTIDYCDMIYYPANFESFINERFDYVFLDEAQDNNNCQTALIASILREKTGRILFVGDKNQSIFGFAGSGIDSFSLLQEKFKTKDLRLTITYRCSREVVKLAQTIYPEDIEAHENAIEGVVRRGELKEANEGDMIICRNTRPLIIAFFHFIQNNKKAYVVGKELEKGLIGLAESCMDYSTTGISLKLDKKLAELAEELKSEGVSKPFLHDKYVALLEKVEIVSLILSKVNHPLDLVSKIEEIFHPDKKAIRLLTMHRSKGLECNRVFYIETYNSEKLCPSKYALLDWQKIQEQNLLFVTYTRAKQEFVFVDLVD